MSIYGYSKDLFRKFISFEQRRKIWSGNNFLTIVLLRFKKLMLKVAEHDEIYDNEYYNSVVDAPMLQSAPVISDSIHQEFDPLTVIDVGCGTGALLMELQQRGITGIGLEYSTAALKYCQTRGLKVKKFDIESYQAIDDVADVCISTEVAEHLPATYANKYVDLLTKISDIVVMTAAPPGQGGTDHVNEQPNEYWIEKFQQRKFDFDSALTLKLRREWEAKNVFYWYYQNVMIFKKCLNHHHS
ncbi:MAG: class I SAM-dependent methyltransferase [Sphaerospermopsis sp. SIO1G1]|nr:class I SAM-dependent methyltransferase [Sphaerospermopsis sp. SIO1G1]